jgi:hypothetical protein
LEAKLRVSAIAKWFIHRTSTAAKRECRFARNIVGVADGIDEFQSAGLSFHPIGAIPFYGDSYLCHTFSSLSLRCWNRFSLDSAPSIYLLGYSRLALRALYLPWQLIRVHLV